MMRRAFAALTALLMVSAAPLKAQGLATCDFGFEIDTQSSAFQSMLVDGEQKRGFWLSINRAPADVRKVAKHIGRLQVCLMTEDGKPAKIKRGGQTLTLNSPFVTNCTAALLPNNRLLTNAHCFYDPSLVKGGFKIVREARINFNYTSKDDTGAVQTYLVSPREVAVDKKLDALLLQIIGADANGALGGHIPMKMMTNVQPLQELRMIHHPAAEPQQYSTGTCQVHRRQSEIGATSTPFRHTCESTGGSSGSLLLDARTFAVVGLHNQGGLGKSGESYNGGHKIAMVNSAFNLGFEEVSATGGGGGGGSAINAAAQREAAANKALTDALLTTDPAAQAAALRQVMAQYPNSDVAGKAVAALKRLDGNTANNRIAAANRALTAALLMDNASARNSALQAIGRDYPGTSAADQAAVALKRFQSNTNNNRAAAANNALTAALLLDDAARKEAALLAVGRDYAGTPAASQATKALQRLQSDRENQRVAIAIQALTNALLTDDKTARANALRRVAQDYAGTSAATKAASALKRLEDEMAQNQVNSALAKAAQRALDDAQKITDKNARIVRLDQVAASFRGTPAASSAALAADLLRKQVAADTNANTLLVQAAQRAFDRAQKTININERIAQLDQVALGFKGTPAGASAAQAADLLRKKMVAKPKPKPKPKPPVPASWTYELGPVSEQAINRMRQVSGETLNNILNNRRLICGVTIGIQGFSIQQTAEEWTGLDVDMCRAVAAAILGDPFAVDFVPTQGFEALQAVSSGSIDMLARRPFNIGGFAQEYALDQAGTIFFDALGLMLRADLGVNSAFNLSGAAVCFLQTSEDEFSLDKFFQTNGMNYHPVPFSLIEEAEDAFFRGECDVLASQMSHLAALEAFAGQPGEFVVMPELVTERVQSGPLVWNGDQEFRAMIQEVVFVLRRAEELGITYGAVNDRSLPTTGPGADYLRTSTPGTNLPADYKARILSTVGHYGEMYDFNLGPNSQINLPRGWNSN